MNQTPQPRLDDYIAKAFLEGESTFWTRNRPKIDFVLRKASPRLAKARRACEVGIGEGRLLRKLAQRGLHVTGIDISGYLVRALGEKFATEGVDVELIEGDIVEAPLADGSFDAVFCLDVLEHIPGEGLAKALAKIRRALSQGGNLIATLPVGEILADNMVCCPKCGHEFHRVGHHHAFADAGEVRELFEPGFRIVTMGHVPVHFTRSPLLNQAADWLLRLARRVLGFRPKDTVYVIASPAEP